MRIVLDLQGAQSQSRFRGIGRYALSLAKAIVRRRDQHEIFVALSALLPDRIGAIRTEMAALLPEDHILVWHAPGPVREYRESNDWRRLAAEQIRESFLAGLAPDLVHVFSMLEGFGDNVVTGIGPLSASFVTTVTLYDLIPMLNRASFLEPDPRFERHYLRKLDQLKHADGWLTISESSARHGRDDLGLPEDRLINVSAAFDENFRPRVWSPKDHMTIRRRLGITDPFVLAVGGAEPTKNLDRLVRAYALVPREVRDNHQLVLAGAMIADRVADLRRTVRSAGLDKNRVVFPGFVDDLDLVFLYSTCVLFVLPSTHEGFGLPAIEAMACGAPVIGSNASSIPEVIGWPAALFDPLDETSIAEKMRESLTRPAFRSELIHRGLKQAKRFSWDESARRAIAAFELIHRLRGAGRPSVPRLREALIEQLMERIGQVDVGDPSDQDLLATAVAIDRNLALARTLTV